MCSQVTIKQHIIPASYISHFSAETSWRSRDQVIYYFDTRSDKVLLDKPGNICTEDLYFEMETEILDVPNQVNAIENEIASFENASYELIKNKPNFLNVTQDEFQHILHYITHLYMRGPDQREDIRKILESRLNELLRDPRKLKEHKQKLRESGRNLDIFDRICSPEWIKKLAQIVHSGSILWYSQSDPLYDKEFKKFTEYQYDIISLESGEDFISSDTPVWAYKNYIIFPLTRRACLLWAPKWIALHEHFKGVNINQYIALQARYIIYWASKEIIEKYKGLVGSSLKG